LLSTEAVFKIQEHLPVLRRLKANIKVKDMAAISMFVLMPNLEELVLCDYNDARDGFGNFSQLSGVSVAVREFNRNFHLLLPKLRIFGTNGIVIRKSSFQSSKNYRFQDLDAIQPCNLEEIEADFDIKNL
jgi:hypothetical protein